jgi:hypothetical protein
LINLKIIPKSYKTILSGRNYFISMQLYILNFSVVAWSAFVYCHY